MQKQNASQTIITLASSSLFQLIEFFRYIFFKAKANTIHCFFILVAVCEFVYVFVELHPFFICSKTCSTLSAKIRNNGLFHIYTHESLAYALFSHFTSSYTYITCLVFLI